MDESLENEDVDGEDIDGEIREDEEIAPVAAPHVIINLLAIKCNYTYIKTCLKQGTVLSAVVKYDAYGLGAKDISSFLYNDHGTNCRDFWCTYASDAIALRASGALPLDANVYYLQGFEDRHVDLIKKYSIIPTINSAGEFMTAKDRGVPMVLHVDTGFTRLAMRDYELESVMEYIPSEDIRYVMSHLACGDEAKSPMNGKQKSRFDEILKKVREVRPGTKATLAATGGIFLGKDYHYDMVRCGAFLYGINASEYGERSIGVVSVAAFVLQTYSVPAKTSVGYGSDFITKKKETKVAVVAIGYADGVNRALSNGKGKVAFYHSDSDSTACYRAPIIGRISMDLLVCDVTLIPDGVVQHGSIAVILDVNHTVNEMANEVGTIPYEILTSMNFRSKRTYSLIDSMGEGPIGIKSAFDNV
jgi:alanine racemase